MEVWAIELVSQCIHTLVKHTYKTEMLKIAPFMLLLSAFVLWSNAYHSTLNLTLTQTVSHPSLSAGKKGRKRMWPNRFTPVVCIPFTFKVVLISFFFFFFFFLFSFSLLLSHTIYFFPSLSFILHYKETKHLIKVTKFMIVHITKSGIV